MICRYLRDYFKYRNDIKGPISWPDFSKKQDEYLNPFTDTSLLVFFMTRRCNLNCSFCYLNLTKYKTEFSDLTYDATVDSVHKLMKKPLVRRMHGVSLFGGEPLVNPKVDQIVDAFLDYKKVVYMTTNGLLLGNHLELLQKIDRISISVYQNTLDTLAKMLPTLIPRNPFVLTFALTKTTLLQNATILDRLFELASTTNCESVNVFTVSPSAQTATGELDVSEAIFEDTPEGELYKQKASELKEKFPENTSNFYAPQVRGVSESGKIKCTFAWWYICCDAFGNVSPCACVAPPEEKYGNIFKDNFMMANTWNSEKIRIARRWFNSDNTQDIPKICENCIHLNRRVL